MTLGHVVVGIVVAFLGLVAYFCCGMSSLCSREEEEKFAKNLTEVQEQD